MQRVFTIKPETIETIHKYVFENKFEICANLKKTEDNTLFLHNIKVCTEKYRSFCNHPEYSNNIIHTHPYLDYAYPSTDDIIKIIKHYNKIVNSLVATKWGIWVLSNTTTSNIYSESQHKKLYNLVEKYTNELGMLTTSTNDNEEKINNKSKDIDENDYSVITEFNVDILNLLNVKIDLYTWDDILNKGFDIYGITDIDAF